MALTMGRAESTRQAARGRRDRSGRAAARAGRRPSPNRRRRSAPRAIALDDMIAGLLDARFDVSEDGDGLVLGGERALIAGRQDPPRPAHLVRGARLGARRADRDPRRVHRRAAGAGRGRDGAGRAGQVAPRRRAREPRPAARATRSRSGSAAATRCAPAPPSTCSPRRCAGRSASRAASRSPERHDKLRARVAERVPTADQQRVTEFLGELVGAPFPTARTAARSSRRRARTPSSRAS